MPSFNRVILMGHLTRDPAMKSLPNGTACCECGIAVNNSYNKDRPLFIDLVLFGKSAESFNTYMSKGKAAIIEGRLDLDQWADKDGNKRSKHKVTADNWGFAGSKDDNKGGKNAAPAPDDAQKDDDIPF